MLTTHCLPLGLIPTGVFVDLELEFLLGIGYLPDLISFIYEVP